MQAVYVFSVPGRLAHVKVTNRRTKQDFAVCINDLIENHSPAAEKIRVVLDNLSIHTLATFYAAFPPEQARRLAKKLAFHYTPKHSSWLNMAEVEISVLTEQCLDCRLGSQEIVARVIGTGNTEQNNIKATIEEVIFYKVNYNKICIFERITPYKIFYLISPHW